MQKQIFDTIVIGAGLGGLIAGARLAKKGQKVLVLEQHYIPGGCATTFKRKDFIMEVGLHELDGLDAYDPKTTLFHELDIYKHVTFKKLPELYRAVHVQQSLDCIVPDNSEQAQQALIAQYPDEKKGITAYFVTISAIRRELFILEKSARWKLLLSMPVFPLRFPYLTMVSSRALRWLARVNPLFWIFKPKLALFGVADTIGNFLDKSIRNDALKTLLLANLSYYHDDPYSLSTLYYSAAQASYYNGGGYFIKGGSQTLSDYLADLICKHGGTVMLGKRVDTIHVENGRATGVSYANAYDEHAPSYRVCADTIVANAAIPRVVHMLPERERRILERKTRNLAHSCSLISVYIGFRKDLKKELRNKAYSTFMLYGELSPQGLRTSLALDPEAHNKTFVFVDYSQIDSGIAPAGKSVGVICSVDYLHHWQNLSEAEYKAKKERVATTLIQQLDTIVPGMSKAVEYYEVGTPQTILKYTLNPLGSTYGFAQTPSQAGIFRFPQKSPVPNLYFASSWTFPGGGFTGAIISGKSCSEQIERRMSGIRTTNKPPILPDTQTAKVLKKSIIGRNTIELVCEKPDDFSRFRPGQYAVVRLNTPKHTSLDMPFRSLSMASHPDDDVLRFAMRTGASAFKQSCEAIDTGDTVTLYGPMGDFCIRNTGTGIVFLAAGIGITPILSFLAELQKQSYAASVYLYYSNKTRQTTAYNEHLTSLQLPDFTYRPIFTRTRQRRKRIDRDILYKDIASFEGLAFYIVGTNGFADSMQAMLLSEKVPADCIHIDSFG